MSNKRPPLAESIALKEEPDTKKPHIEGNEEQCPPSAEPDNGAPDTPAPPQTTPLPAVDLKLDSAEADVSIPKTTEKLSSPNIIVFGLHPSVNQENLGIFLQQFGNVKSLKIKMAFSSKYALVEFETLAMAQATLSALQGRKLLGKLLVVKGTAR